MQRLSGNLSLILYGALLVVGAGLTLSEEIGAMRANNASSVRGVTVLAVGEANYGLSIGSRLDFLLACRSAMVSLAARVQPAEIRRSLNEYCLRSSDRIVAEQPTFSVAWATGALAASQLADWVGFDRRLVNSMHTGATEQWVAEIRVPMAEQYFDKLSAVARYGHESDIRLMTGTDSGLLELARLYAQLSTSRGRISAVLDRTSNVTQEKFLNRIQLFSPEVK